MARAWPESFKLLLNPDRNCQNVYQHLINDKVVRGFLLIHDLHPADLETRLRDALDHVRPYLQSHGGNVELISLTGQRPVCDSKAPAKLRFFCGDLRAGHTTCH